MPSKNPHPPARPRKKSWQRARIKRGRLFESNSLACGKNGLGVGGGCDNFPKMS